MAPPPSRAPWPPAPGSRTLRGRWRELGQAEVEHLHEAAVGDHDVARLHVAVHHPAVVRLLERLGHLPRDREGFRGGERAFAQTLEEGVAPHVLHGDEASLLPLLLELAHLVDHRDVRMAERGGHAGFAEQTPRGAFVLFGVGPQHLEGHGAMQAQVLGQVDVARGPGAEPLAEAIVQEHALVHLVIIPPMRQRPGPHPSPPTNGRTLPADPSFVLV